MDPGEKQLLLTGLAAEAAELGEREYDESTDAAIYRLRERVRLAAAQVFPPDHWLAADLPQLTFAPTAWPATKHDYQLALRDGTARLAELLRSAAATLNVQTLSQAQLAGQFGLGPPPAARPTVFVSHGADEAMLAAVLRQLGSMGLQPVVLREAAGIGESGARHKLERHTDAVFSVVLLGHGDMLTHPSTLVELGYCWGKLGPERVLCFVRPDAGTALPADYLAGLCRVFDDHGDWQDLLRQGLAQARAI